jgi:hypothetical protein
MYLLRDDATMLPPNPPIAGLSHIEAAARQTRESPIATGWRRVVAYGTIITTNLVTTLNIVILGLAATLWSLGNLRVWLSS